MRPAEAILANANQSAPPCPVRKKTPPTQEADGEKIRINAVEFEFPAGELKKISTKARPKKGGRVARDAPSLTFGTITAKMLQTITNNVRKLN
jgi:hypothetical protein